MEYHGIRGILKQISHNFIIFHMDFLQVGDSFGEVALQTDQPRAATVKTKGDAIFATLIREAHK